MVNCIIVIYLPDNSPESERKKFLLSLDAQVTRAKLQAFTQGTNRNRVTQIRAFVLFCFHANLHVCPVSPQTLCRYIVFLSRSMRSYQSIKNYVDGVRFYQVSHGIDFDLWDHPEVKIVLRATRKHLGDNPRRKLPITPDILRKVFSCLKQDSIIHVVLWASFLVAFYGFLRKANVVPPSGTEFDLKKHLSRGSFVFQEGRILLSIQHTKTIQFQQRKIVIPLLEIPGSVLCPVRAITLMFEKVPAPADAPAFVIPYQGGFLSLTHSSYVQYLKHFLALLGLDASQYSGHSFRRCGCTFAAKNGVSAHLLKIHGDWSSDAYERYMDLSQEARLDVMKVMSSALT